MSATGASSRGRRSDQADGSTPEPSLAPVPVSAEAFEPAPAGPGDLRWYEALIRFNLDPAAYADPSWLPSWAGSARPPEARMLSAALLQAHGLAKNHDWVLDDRATRIFLIAPNALRDLALGVGIAAHRDSLRRVVKQHDLQALRASLGDALDTLWLPLAETIPRSRERIERATLEVAAIESGELSTLLRTEGARQLLRLIDGSAPARRGSAARAAFCAPRRLALESPQADGSPTASTRLLDAVIDSLVPQWAPAWTWLF